MRLGQVDKALDARLRDLWLYHCLGLFPAMPGSCSFILSLGHQPAGVDWPGCLRLNPSLMGLSWVRYPVLIQSIKAGDAVTVPCPAEGGGERRLLRAGWASGQVSHRGARGSHQAGC